MTCSSLRIDLAARRLLSSIAGTRDARVSAMALTHMRGAGKTLMDAGLLVQRGGAMSVAAEDDLDDDLFGDDFIAKPSATADAAADPSSSSFSFEDYIKSNEKKEKKSLFDD